MDEDEALRQDRRTSYRMAFILAGIILAAFLLSLIASCASTDRQWQESETILQSSGLAKR